VPDATSEWNRTVTPSFNSPGPRSPGLPAALVASAGELVPLWDRSRALAARGALISADTLGKLFALLGLAA